MAARKKPTVPAPETEAPAVETAYIRDLDAHLAITPHRHRSEQKLREGLTRILRERHAAIEAAVGRMLEDGLSLEEINAFCAIQTPLMPTVVTEDGKERVEWPFRIIGPDD